MGRPVQQARVPPAKTEASERTAVTRRRARAGSRGLRVREDHARRGAHLGATHRQQAGRRERHAARQHCARGVDTERATGPDPRRKRGRQVERGAAAGDEVGPRVDVPGLRRWRRRCWCRCWRGSRRRGGRRRRRRRWSRGRGRGRGWCRGRRGSRGGSRRGRWSRRRRGIGSRADLDGGAASEQEGAAAQQAEGQYAASCCHKSSGPIKADLLIESSVRLDHP